MALEGKELIYGVIIFVQYYTKNAAFYFILVSSQRC